MLHALLICRDGWFGVEGLAESAGASPAKASERLPALERLAVKGQGPSKELGLTAPGSLLDGWRKRTLAAPRRRECRRFHVPAGDPDAIANRLAETCGRPGLDQAPTEQGAARTHAPFPASVPRVTCRLTFGRHVNEPYAEPEARTVSEGGNPDANETRSRGGFLFREHVGPLWLASSVQVNLDSLRSGGRGKEMAERLRRERTGFR